MRSGLRLQGARIASTIHMMRDTDMTGVIVQVEYFVLNQKTFAVGQKGGKMKPNCWDCKHFEIVGMSAYCHGGKRVTKLRQKDWYSGTIKFCTYFEPKQAERREE